MKRFIQTATLVLFTAGASGLASAQGVSMMVRGGALVPDRSDEWKVGGAFDLGMVFWASPTVGLWLGSGAQGWSMSSETASLESGGWFTVDGRVALVPFGASLLIRGDLEDRFSLLAEGGFRYAIVDSDATVESWQPHSRNTMAVYEDPIDIEDTVLAVASLQLDYTVNMWRLGVGAGFQWDLAKPDQKLGGQKISNAVFDAAFFFFSAAIDF